MLPDQHGDRALWRDGATILILALAPAIGVGIARFAYSLVLPDCVPVSIGAMRRQAS